jgi:hypothetical protein
VPEGNYDRLLQNRGTLGGDGDGGNASGPG